MKVKVFDLSWGGDMVKKTIEIEDIDRSVLIVDDWFYPEVGDLCINDEGKLDICTEITKVPPKDPFKGYNLYSFKNSKTKTSQAHLVRVKKGKTYNFDGITFVSKRVKY